MSIGSKGIDVDVDIEVWIEKFNKAKGWKTLKAPRPEALSHRDRSEKFKSSPSELLEKRFQAIGGKEDREEAEKQAKQERLDIDNLKLQLAGADEDDKPELQEEIDRRELELQEQTANIELFDKLSERQKRLKEVEDPVPESLKAQGKKLGKLQSEVDDHGVDLSKLDKNLLARFRSFHDGVANNIENARQEVISMDVEVDGTPVKNNFAVINSDEYKLLFGMLEESILTLQLGKPDEALVMVQAASEKLVKFRNARTGAEAIEQRESFGSKLDEQLHLTEMMIDSLRKDAFDKVADQRKKTLSALLRKMRSAVNSGATNLTELFFDECEALAKLATDDVRIVGEIKELAIEARRDVLAMRANGHVHRPDRVEDKLSAFDPGASTAKALTAMQVIRKYAEDKYKECLAEDLEAAEINPKKLEKDKPCSKKGSTTTSSTTKTAPFARSKTPRRKKTRASRRTATCRARRWKRSI